MQAMRGWCGCVCGVGGCRGVCVWGWGVCRGGCGCVCVCECGRQRALDNNFSEVKQNLQT